MRDGAGGDNAVDERGTRPLGKQADAKKEPFAEISIQGPGRLNGIMHSEMRGATYGGYSRSC